MRRILTALAAVFILALPPASPVRAQAGNPPHAFLFGAWTGGLFPPPSEVSARSCLAAPSVIFTRDAVLVASLTSVLYVQRAIETVRGTGNGVAFRFVHGADALGCVDPDALTVTRLTSNQITFAHCTDFPFPLVRCPAG